MPSNLQESARTALAAMTDVIASYDECAKVIVDVREEFAENSLQISPSIEFAVWAKIHFDGDWSAFHRFVKTAVQEYSSGGFGPEDKSQLWVWKTPDRTTPEPGVKRLLDSIDIALHYCAKELDMELPAKTVSDGGWHEREHLERLHQFCLALNDVLNHKRR